MPFAMMAGRLAASRLGADALHFPGAAQPGTAIRVVVAAPGQAETLGTVGGVAISAVLTTPVAALPLAQAGDEILVGDQLYQVMAAGRDSSATSWRLSCRLAPAEPRATTLLQAATR